MVSSQQFADPDMLRRLSVATLASPRVYLASAHRLLEQLAEDPGLLDGVALQRQAGTYAKTLLFGDDRMSIWAIVWDVGARTPVHDHHCSCCFAMLSGWLQERRFQALDRSTAVRTGDIIRGPGHVACMLPDGPNLHQMVNDGDREAISLHIYGFDHQVHASSVDREYRVLAQ